LHEDGELVAFLDIAPIRPGHTVIVAKSHVPTCQQLARRMKEVYKVERVAFFFTGTDVAHAHAHVVAMHDKMDVTSQRYIVSGEDLQWSSAQLRTDAETLKRVRDELAFRAK
jgi:histidine triad (HIT) family protein